MARDQLTPKVIRPFYLLILMFHVASQLQLQLEELQLVMNDTSYWNLFFGIPWKTFYCFCFLVLPLSMLAEEFFKEVPHSGPEPYAAYRLKLVDGYRKNAQVQTSEGADPESSRTKVQQLLDQRSKANPHELHPRKASSSDLPTNNNKALVPNYKTVVIPPEFSPVTFADLRGIEKLTSLLHENVIVPLVSAVNSKVSKNTPRGIIFVGGPGTGKTAICQAIVNQFRSLMDDKKVTFHWVDVTSYLGSVDDANAGVTLRGIYRDAMQSRQFAVILMDNIDKLHERSFKVFLDEYSSIPRGQVLLIATARSRQRLHDGVVQVLDFTFDLELPTLSERADILRLHFAKRHCPAAENDVLDLAQLTASFTAGELEKLVSIISKRAREKYRELVNQNCELP